MSKLDRIVVFVYAMCVIGLIAFVLASVAKASTDTVTSYQQRLHRSTSTMNFFLNRKHRWMLARRHEDCWSGVPWSKTCDRARRAYLHARHEFDEIVADPRGAIVYVFGPDAWAALNVAWCESKYSPWASNGQYKGIFQMGTRERAKYGDGSTALEQAEAARAYYLDAGWSPWECRP